jgi:hypothetical protein
MNHIETSFVVTDKEVLPVQVMENELEISWLDGVLSSKMDRETYLLVARLVQLMLEQTHKKMVRFIPGETK